MSIIGDISTFKSEFFSSPRFSKSNLAKILNKCLKFTDGESFNFPTTSTAMMTGSLPSSSSSSTTSSTGSSRQTNDDQFVDDLVSRLIKEDAEDDLVTGLNSLLKQWVFLTNFTRFKNSLKDSWNCVYISAELISFWRDFCSIFCSNYKWTLNFSVFCLRFIVRNPVLNLT